jgi:ATP-binding cassette subfamily C protein LapB
MDAQLEARVMKHLFEEISPETTLVVVTHKTALLTHVNRIIVVDKGRIVADGPRDQVLARLQQARPMSVVSPSSQASQSTVAAA